MGSDASTRLKTFLKKSRELLKDKDIDDIIVFGSTVKGSSKPHDLDVALILRDESGAARIKEDIRRFDRSADIEVVSSIRNPLWAVLMREGYSIRVGKPLHQVYNIEPVVLYRYSLKKLSPTQKVQFTRGLKAMLGDTNAKILSRSVVLVPMDRKNSFDEFLTTWDLKYEAQSYELFPMLRKHEIV
jgi:predicted nucleotidyltransferase